MGYRIVVALIVYPIAVTARQIVDMGADENFSLEQLTHLLPLIYTALGFVIFMFAGGVFALLTFRKRPRFAWFIAMCFIGYFPGGALMKFFS